MKGGPCCTPSFTPLCVYLECRLLANPQFEAAANDTELPGQAVSHVMSVEAANLPNTEEV
jgi:hypothetical protein